MSKFERQLIDELLLRRPRLRHEHSVQEVLEHQLAHPFQILWFQREQQVLRVLFGLGPRLLWGCIRYVRCLELLGQEERAQLEDLAEVLSQLFVLAAHVWRQLHLNKLVELRSTRPGCRLAVQHSQQDQVWNEDPLLRELL